MSKNEICHTETKKTGKLLALEEGGSLVDLLSKKALGTRHGPAA